MRKRRITVIGAVVLAASCVLLLLPIWYLHGHGASLSQLASVRPGMTRDQVTAMLGRPGTINRASDGSESWFYTRSTFCQVKVYMSSVGVVSETDHDH